MFRFSAGPVALSLAFLSAGVNTADAASVTDYAGLYDMYYTRASAALTITLVAADGQEIVIPVSVDQQLVDEMLPDSAVDPVVDKTLAFLESKITNIPTFFENVIDVALTNALVEVVAQINSAAMVLPDQVALGVLSTRNNSIEGVFDDVDGTAEDFSLAGGLDPVTGDFSMMDVFYGRVDPAANYTGWAAWGLSNVDVQQEANGVNVRVTGSAELVSDFRRMEPAAAAPSTSASRRNLRR